MPQVNEKELLARLKRSDKQAFRQLFDQFYKYLLVTAINVLGDREMAKDMVQDVFFELWKRRETLMIQSSLKSYLRRAAVNKILNHIKRSKKFDNTEPDHYQHLPQAEASVQEELEAGDLQGVINQAIESLPERCRIIFTLCRLESLSHKQVAQQLNISTKTVENQMTKALKILKAAVAPHISKGLLFVLIANDFIYWVGF